MTHASRILRNSRSMVALLRSHERCSNEARIYDLLRIRRERFALVMRGLDDI
jgi:hypothetical protein